MSFFLRSLMEMGETIWFSQKEHSKKYQLFKHESNLENKGASQFWSIAISQFYFFKVEPRTACNVNVQLAHDFQSCFWTHGTGQSHLGISYPTVTHSSNWGTYHYRSCIWRFPKTEVPLIIHFNGIFHWKPTIFGNPNFGNPHPYIHIYIYR